MASVQDRLHVTRFPLDKWTLREQLCLLSVVSCSGEQNWMCVSRALRVLCTSGNRPADWFSQKSCSLQYGYLLEHGEAQKRKSRSTECSSGGMSSPINTVDSPTDLALRRLIEERIQEIKSEIRKEQEEYSKIYNELKAMQAGKLTEEQLLDMWHDIEQQQENKRIEEMKLENQMREREQRRQEAQRVWRMTSVANVSQKLAVDTTAVDMDVEEIIDSARQVQSGNQQAEAPQSGTSPLLSSLLKSPTSTGGPITNTPAAMVNANPARATATAPTITTLLTSGSIPNTNQPAITLKRSIPANEAVQLLTRPISGPPIESLSSSSSSSAQNLLSPSQSAPTLSMLLEKNKIAANSNSQVYTFNVDAKNYDKSQTKGENISDSNNDVVPMDIEEEAATVPKSPNHDAASVDADEPDPNEEQQLMEVFKNIGNIDELDIDVAAVIDDEEVDFLKGVDEDPSNESEDIKEFDTNIEESTVASNDIKTEDSKEDSDAKMSNPEKRSDKHIAGDDENNTGAKDLKVETISSDDSNDNIPLATVASLENKERIQHSDTLDENSFLKGKLETSSNNLDNESLETSQLNAENDTDVELLVAADDSIDEQNGNEKNGVPVPEKSSVESESPDVIIIPTDDESSGDRTQKTPDKADLSSEITAIDSPSHEKTEDGTNDLKNDFSTVELKLNADISNNSKDATLSGEQDTPAAQCETTSTLPTISIGDTDDDSSFTDISIITRKDDKIISQRPSRRTVTEVPRNENRIDDDTAATAAVPASPTTIPARPPVLRKLRDRDRSESPMVDAADATTANETSVSQRSRRLYSSTPVIDSIPNSPVSIDRDDGEGRTSKKVLLSIYNTLQNHKSSLVFQRAIIEEFSPKYNEVCFRQMDMQMIKKHIELGVIRNITELQRDIMLMCQNGMMLFATGSENFKLAHTFMQECQSVREFIASGRSNDNILKVEKEPKDLKPINAVTPTSSGVVRMRGSSRKSQRIT